MCHKNDIIKSENSLMFSQLSLLDFHSLNCPECYFAHNLWSTSKHRGDGHFYQIKSIPKVPIIDQNIGKSFKIYQKHQENP